MPLVANRVSEKNFDLILLYLSARSLVLTFLEREKSVLYHTSWVVTDSVRAASSWGMQNTFESCSAVTPLLFPAVTEANVVKAAAIDKGMASKIAHELLDTEMLPIIMDTCDISARSDSPPENTI